MTRSTRSPCHLRPANSSTASRSKTSKKPKKSAGNPGATKTRFASMQAGFFRPWFVNSLPLITYPEPWFMVRGKESGCCQRDPISPPSNSPLPLPDSGIVLMRGRWFTNLVTQASTHLANQDHEFWSVAQNQKVCLVNSTAQRSLSHKTKSRPSVELRGGFLELPD